MTHLGLACKIGTFLGPNLDFGPIWDFIEAPESGAHMVLEQQSDLFRTHWALGLEFKLQAVFGTTIPTRMYQNVSTDLLQKILEVTTHLI